MKKYDHKKIEQKWQQRWQETTANTIDKDDTSKPKFYLLDMYPYPSGDGLHMGHTEAYAANDIFSRYKKANGFNVLHPTGFDSFGLPAENYAIKTGVHPKETTATNCANFTQQLKSLGIDYDYDEMVTTSNPDYYKWTQWLFVQFFKHNLVYKKTDTVNWCESCKTVLANEQVESGACERCKNDVVQKPIPSWFFKITDFAQELIDGHEKIDWPEHTRKNQINWIGKSEGAEITFPIENHEESITVFTTRPDTLFGATYMVLAPEHVVVTSLLSSLENTNDVQDYINATKRKTDLERTVDTKEKTGVELKGVRAINPVTKEEIPIFIADYVLAHYGTGAIMAVPAHDERDHAFAKVFGLPIKEVVIPHRIDKRNPPVDGKNTIERRNVHVVVRNPKDEKVIVLKWKKHSWNTFPMGGIEDGEEILEAAQREVLEETGYKNLTNGRVLGGPVHAEYFATHKDVNRISQTYLTVFDLVDDTQESLAPDEADAHEVTWMDLKDLTLEFMTHAEMDIWLRRLADADDIYTDKGILINSGDFSNMPSTTAQEKITTSVGGEMKTTYKLRDWSISRQRYWGAPIPIVYDPEGNAHVVPDEHLPWLLPEDVDFVPTGEAPLSLSKELKSRTEKIFGEGWTPEVDTMDTFVCSSWYYLRYPDPHNTEEFCRESRLQHWLPVDLYVGGAEHTYLHLMYARFFTKALHKIGILNFDEPFLKLRHQGMVLDPQGVKMSKSKGNVVNPDDMVGRFGADAVRLYMMFAAPLADEVLWNENGIVGTVRFLERIWRLSENLSETTDDALGRTLHRTIKKVGEDIEQLKYNTAIASMMSFINDAEKKPLSRDDYQLLLRILAPFAPHITEELWEILGNRESIHTQPWSAYSEAQLEENRITLAVQINGKVRGDIEIERDTTQEEIEKIVRADAHFQKWLSGEVLKVILVPGKLINFVVAV